MTHTWQDVCLALIAILPGTVAAIVSAVSSVKNGTKIDKHNGELGRSIDKLHVARKIGRN